MNWTIACESSLRRKGMEEGRMSKRRREEKRQQLQNRRVLRWVLGATIVAVVLGIVVWQGSVLSDGDIAGSALPSTTVDSSDPFFLIDANRIPDKTAIREYIKSFPADNWWIHEQPDRRDSNRLSELTGSFERQLDSCASVFKNETVAQLLTDFDERIYPGFFLHREGAMLTAQPFPKSGIRVAAVMAAETGKLPAAFWYHSDLLAVVIAGRSMTLPIFCSRWFHELLHARHHQILGSTSATAEAGSDEWISEEVYAHLLERELYTEWSGGQYQTLLTEIAGEQAADSVHEFLGALRPEHLDRLNRLFPPATRGEVATRVGNFFFDLLFTWTEMKRGGGIEDKIRAYRAVRTYNRS